MMREMRRRETVPTYFLAITKYILALLCILLLSLFYSSSLVFNTLFRFQLFQPLVTPMNKDFRLNLGPSARFQPFSALAYG